MSNRPYPEGLAWDEAWRQRQRADRLEEGLTILEETVLKLVKTLEKELQEAGGSKGESAGDG